MFLKNRAQILLIIYSSNMIKLQKNGFERKKRRKKLSVMFIVKN